MNPLISVLDASVTDSSISDRWYTTFFTAPINAFWESLVPTASTQQDIAFIERHLQLKLGAHVLDVPCGAGRHSLELARRGFRVTGVDLSDDAVARARQSANAESLPLTVLQADMSNLQLNQQFDGAICMGNSFGYLTHADMLEFIGSMHGHLQPGARFIVDSGMAAESILANMKREAKYEVNGYVFEIKNDYDIARSRLLTHTVLCLNKEEWRQSFSHGVYTSGELGRMFDENGFVVERMYADTNDTAFTLGQSRLLLIASRR